MIIEYHRPYRIEDAIALLERQAPKTVPMGGGTSLSRQKSGDEIAVVDLQGLGLDQLEVRASQTIIGGAAKLQSILEEKGVDEVIKKAIASDAPLNIRNMATIGGVIASGNGRSSLLVVLLAVRARVKVADASGTNEVDIQEWLHQQKHQRTKGIVVSVIIGDCVMSLQDVSKTPRDIPIISLAGSLNGSGKLTLAIGGEGEDPFLICDNHTFDMTDISPVIQYAHSHYTTSDPYKKYTSKIFIDRVITDLQSKFAGRRME